MISEIMVFSALHLIQQQQHTDTSINHTELIARVRQRDSVAIREIFDLYYPRLYFFALKATGNPLDAEDIVQETFVAFWIALTEKEATPDNLQAYIYGMIRNKCISFLRKKKLIDERNAAIAEQFRLETEGELDILEIRNELFQRVSEHFKQLTSIQVQVMTMLYKEDFSVSEVAELLNTTANNVRNHKARAIERLQSLVDGEILLFLLFFSKVL